MALLHTPLCSTLGIQHPIIQAPIGSGSSPALASAVSNAGGLGMLALSWKTAKDISAAIQETQQLTSKPFGINLVLQWPQDERVMLCLKEGIRIFSFSWGDPARFIAPIHAAGGMVMHTVSTADEAHAARENGIDVIIAQGWEAGGHVQGNVALMPLLPKVVDRVAPTPVVAAGGIGDGRGLAAALALGAAGIWLGTRFLASEEASIHPLYQEKLLEASESDTLYSQVFDEGWPHAPHRTLQNTTTWQWQQTGSLPSGKRPGEGEIIGHFKDGSPIQRYSDVIPLPGMSGDLEAMALYAGQSVGLVNKIQPAEQIMQQLVSETLQAIHQTHALVR